MTLARKKMRLPAFSFSSSKQEKQGTEIIYLSVFKQTGKIVPKHVI